MDTVYTAPCSYCGTAIDPLARATYRRVVGWERKAISASRKSGSDITLREPRDEYACPSCISRLQSSLNPGQVSLI